jgi:hypothetical protein
LLGRYPDFSLAKARKNNYSLRAENITREKRESNT